MIQYKYSYLGVAWVWLSRTGVALLMRCLLKGRRGPPTNRRHGTKAAFARSPAHRRQGVGHGRSKSFPCCCLSLDTESSVFKRVGVHDFRYLTSPPAPCSVSRNCFLCQVSSEVCDLIRSGLESLRSMGASTRSPPRSFAARSRGANSAWRAPLSWRSGGKPWPPSRRSAPVASPSGMIPARRARVPCLRGFWQASPALSRRAAWRSSCWRTRTSRCQTAASSGSQLNNSMLCWGICA